MAKTTNWITNRFVKVEVEVTAAIVTALGGITTAEWIDISSIFSGPLDQPQQTTRDTEETPVSGDAQPIVSVGPNSARQLTFTMLYTEGETLGTDNLDIYQDLLKPVMEDTTVLSIPFRWSPNGGASGDNLYTTNSTGTFIVSMGDPVGGVTSAKILIPVQVITEDLTVSTI